MRAGFSPDGLAISEPTAKTTPCVCTVLAAIPLMEPRKKSEDVVLKQPNQTTTAQYQKRYWLEMRMPTLILHLYTSLQNQTLQMKLKILFNGSKRKLNKLL